MSFEKNMTFHRRQAPTFQNSNNKKKTPFCSVCKAANRSDFNTHYVRDRPGGNVVCKYLLSLNCGYCGEAGHTPSHCPILKQKKLDEQRKRCKPVVSDDGFINASSRGTSKTKHLPQSTTSKAAGQKRKRGGFAALADDSDDEEVLHEMPAVAVHAQPTPSLGGWIAAVNKPALVNKPAAIKEKIVLKNGNWADDMSDDDEDW